MRNAKFVIFSGGHATCFETIKYSKPSICIPTQPEQLGNAAKLQDLNCSITVKNKSQLQKAVDENGKRARILRQKHVGAQQVSPASLKV